MSERFDALTDEFFLNTSVQTALPLPESRETILQFCEAFQREFPDMTMFYQRGAGEFVLEGDRDSGCYRWMELEPRQLSAGYFNPPDVGSAMQQHRWMLDRCTCYLGVSYLDIECLDVTLGFNMDYRGNRDAIVAEALLAGSPLAGLTEDPQVMTLGFEPSLVVTLNPECYMQARLSIETRNSSYQVRTGNYEDEPISVYFTIRGYPQPGEKFDMLAEFDRQCQALRDLTDKLIVPRIIRPIASAIATSR